MLSRFRPRLTYANVTATLALFVALGGGAYAATQVSGDKLIKKGTLSGNRLRMRKITGTQVQPFVGTCGDGSIAALGSWYVPKLPTDPTFVLPNRFGGEGGFACSGAKPQMTKEGTGFYRMEFTKELPNVASYLAFINPDARGSAPLYGDANFDLAANGHSAWDIHVFDKAGTPADPYYIEVLLTKLQ